LLALNLSECLEDVAGEKRLPCTWRRREEESGLGTNVESGALGDTAVAAGGLALRVGTTRGPLKLLPHFQGCHTQRPHHLEGKETKNVDNVVVGPHIEIRAKVDELAEPTRCSG